MPVLSKATILLVLIFSKMLVFLIRIPLFVARLRMIEITLGTAKPIAQGHDATKTLIPLSMIQQTLQTGR